MPPVRTKRKKRPAAFSREALAEARRIAILRGAAAAFNRHGFANTSMEDVARELAITKPTLYRYFPSKHAILLGCHSLAMDYTEQAIREAAGGANGLDRILRFARENLRSILGALGTFPVITEVDALLPADRKRVIQRRKQISAWFKETLAAGMADGSVVQGDPNLISLYCFGVFNWVPLWYRAEGNNTPDQIVEQYLALFRRTLAA
jgi:AcrR family transcriptional regulator